MSVACRVSWLANRIPGPSGPVAPCAPTGPNATLFSVPPMVLNDESNESLVVDAGGLNDV